MKLVEQHIIKRGHLFFKECDNLTFLSKNLFNAALYAIRQHFFKTDKFLNYNALQKLMQNENNPDYRALPAKVSQWVLKSVSLAFKSFFNATQSYQKNPKKFKGRPKIPRYKHKAKGRNLLTYTIQAISKPTLQQGKIQLSKTNICFKTKRKAHEIKQVRLIPRYGYYVLEVVYEVIAKRHQPNNRYAAIDIGINNLAAVSFTTSNQSFLINGRPLKSMNQYFNKKKAKLMSHIGGRGTSRRIEKLSLKRNNKVNDYLHKASRYIVNQLVSNNITTLVIGKNDYWKQDINIGKINNQHFVSIPHARFIEMLTYKCELEGIAVILQEESYTSKCSFLDGESVRKHLWYKGKRITRGLFRTKDGRRINSDMNASLNILKKAVPNAFSKGIEGVVVHPISVNL